MSHGVVQLTFRQIHDMQLSMWLFDVILLWRHNCATIWRAIWLWRHNEKVCQQVQCQAFGDQAIVAETSLPKVLTSHLAYLGKLANVHVWSYPAINFYVVVCRNFYQYFMKRPE